MNLIDYPYLKWHIIFVLIPSIVIWMWYWKYLIKYKKTLLWITGLSIIWGFIFDLVASPILKLWFFNNSLNIYFAGLPLEEYMFLFFVPQELAIIFLLLRRKFKNA